MSGLKTEHLLFMVAGVLFFASIVVDYLGGISLSTEATAPKIAVECQMSGTAKERSIP